MQEESDELSYIGWFMNKFIQAIANRYSISYSKWYQLYNSY